MSEVALVAAAVGVALFTFVVKMTDSPSLPGSEGTTTKENLPSTEQSRYGAAYTAAMYFPLPHSVDKRNSVIARQVEANIRDGVPIDRSGTVHKQTDVSIMPYQAWPQYYEDPVAAWNDNHYRESGNT
jgi:hypothetical protein